MTREEEIKAKAEELYGKVNKLFPISEFANEEKRNCFIAGAKWADKDFANKVKRVSINYKYDSNLATKINVPKDMIYDELLIRLIHELKHNGLIEIKETQEDNESTIFMCINVLKNDFKKTTEE